MKHSPIWQTVFSRFLIVLILLMPITLSTPNAELAQASAPKVAFQQEDSPIDNSVPGEAIPAVEGLVTDPTRELGNQDMTQPGLVNPQLFEKSLQELPPDVDQTPNPDAPADLSLQENVGRLIAPDTVPTQFPAAPSQSGPVSDLSLGLQTPEISGGGAMGLLTGLTGNLDDFNRINGPLGDAWMDKEAGITIVNSTAQTSYGGFTPALAIHNGIGVNEAMARVISAGSGTTQYAGFAMNYADGQSFVFVKIQDNNSDGFFDTGACYTGNNNIIEFGLGFFYLSGTFSEATFHVTVSADRSVTINLSDLSGGGANQVYVCSGAPAVNGSQFGIASYGGTRLDNVTVEAVNPRPFTSFAEQDGPLGSNWFVQYGNFEIYQQKAFGRGFSPNLATYNSLGANQIEADVSPTPGGNFQYSGLVLNYAQLGTNLFMKVQDNDGNGTFEHGACYIGNNNVGASFGLGFFLLSSPITSAHMKVSVSNDKVVHFYLTNIDGGSGSQYYECSGAPLAEGYGVGIASYGGGRVDNFQVIQDFKDNFNRADDFLGNDWVGQSGDYVIENQKAKGVGVDALATMMGIGGSQIEADISLSVNGSTQYSALILDYGGGITNIFIKVQDNGGVGMFNTAGCYLGNNSSSFGLGFFSLGAPFTTAHMIVSVDAVRVVTLILTNIDGGDDTQAYICGVAPAAEGSQVGIGGYQGGLIDNIRVHRVFGLDMFNRPTGSTGPAWETKDGVVGIVDQTARGLIVASNRTVFTNVTGNVVEGDISANPAGGVNFCAFMLNYGVGSDNLFIKFQNQNADPAFDSIGCYSGNNSGSFGPGYFYLSAPVMNAHARIWVNSARTVTILLSRINGGAGMQLYTCAGAPPSEGDLVGIASWNGGRIDNLVASDYTPTLDAYLPVIIR